MYRIGILHMIQKKALGSGWGDLQVAWKAVPREVKGAKQKGDYDSPDVDAYHYYMSDDDDEQFGKEFGPALPEGTVCASCRHLNSHTDGKCARCGEALEEGFYY